MTEAEAKICCLCGKVFTEWGNNPAPLAPSTERCCDDCNATKVIPARLEALDRGRDQ
jgi:hypothetical protein